MTKFDDLETHKVSKRCNCTLCFVKDIMQQGETNIENVLDYIRELESSGDISVLWDTDGFPTDMERIASKKKFKKMLKELEE